MTIITMITATATMSSTTTPMIIKTKVGTLLPAGGMGEGPGRATGEREREEQNNTGVKEKPTIQLFRYIVQKHSNKI